jgi:hypothetical protein
LIDAKEKNTSTNKIAKIEKNKNIDDLNIDERFLLRRAELRFNVFSDLASRKRRSLRENIKIQSKKTSSQYFINSKIERVKLFRKKRRA